MTLKRVLKLSLHHSACLHTSGTHPTRHPPHSSPSQHPNILGWAPTQGATTGLFLHATPSFHLSAHLMRTPHTAPTALQSYQVLKYSFQSHPIIPSVCTPQAHAPRGPPPSGPNLQGLVLDGSSLQSSKPPTGQRLSGQAPLEAPHISQSV